MVLERFPKIKYCRIKKGQKAPFEKAWQKKPYPISEIQKYLPKEQYGVLCGDISGGLIVIDCDTQELQEAVEKSLPKTHRVRTGSGGTHNYFFSDFTDKVILTTTKHWGEVQGNGSQVVGAGSTHPNGNKYEKLDDDDIGYITKEQLFEAIKDFRKEKSMPETTNEGEFSDHEDIIKQMLPKLNVGSREDLHLALAGYLRKERRLGLNTAKAICQELCLRTGDEEMSSRLRAVEETYLKDEKEIKGVSGLISAGIDTKCRITKELQILTYEDLKNFEVNKNFIIEGFLYPGTVNMIYSPPAQFKSLISAGMGFAISNGKSFLGMETKKGAVLYLDGENSQGIMKERAESIHKGMDLKRNKFPLFFVQGGLLMDSKKNIQQEYLSQIEELIKKEDIKVIIFDTLHRFCLYDENSSDDLNKLYTQVFKPLADELGVAVVFLHHSTKGGGYRGSGDFLGMVDVSYQVQRKPKTNEFTIVNEKCRSGEIPEIKGEIYFGEEVIRFRKLDEQEDETEKVKKIVEVTERVELLFDEQSKLSRKDVFSFLELQKFEFGSTKTVDRALKFLVEKKKTINKDSRGVYTLALE